MNGKLYLANNLIIRGDKGFNPEIVCYNINTGQEYIISPLLYEIIVELLRIKANSREVEYIIKKLKKQTGIDFFSTEYYSNIPVYFPKRKTKIPIAYYPRELEIHLTSFCNLQCRYCVYDTKNKGTFLEKESLLNLFDEIEKNRIFRVILSGGEPLLHPNIKEILLKLRTKRFRVEILTNATLINDELSQFLSSDNFALTCSIDGYNPSTNDVTRGKGSFDKIVKAIDCLIKRNIKYNISCVITKHNYKEILQIIRFAEKLRANSLNFLFMDTIGRGSNLLEWSLSEIEIEKIINQLEKVKSTIPINFINPLDIKIKEHKITNIISCSAGTYRCAIDSTGDVYPCVYAFGFELFRAGNISQQNISDIWKTNKWNVLRGEITLNDLKICKKCNYAKECDLKNCRLRGYKKYGNLYMPYPNCREIKNFSILYKTNSQ